MGRRQRLASAAASLQTPDSTCAPRKPRPPPLKLDEWVLTIFDACPWCNSHRDTRVVLVLWLGTCTRTGLHCKDSKTERARYCQGRRFHSSRFDVVLCPTVLWVSRPHHSISCFFFHFSLFRSALPSFPTTSGLPTDVTLGTCSIRASRHSKLDKTHGYSRDGSVCNRPHPRTEGRPRAREGTRLWFFERRVAFEKQHG